MDLIISLVKGAIFSLIAGTVLLIVAAIVLPETVFLKILRLIKPDLISKRTFLSKVRLIFDYIFNKKDIILEDIPAGATKDLQEDVNKLVKEKRLLEGNMFFLDLLKNLSNMLNFSVLHSGYGEKAVCDILGNSMEYLQYYARQLENCASSENLQERVSMAAEDLQSQVNDTFNFLRSDESEHKMLIVKSSLKKGTSIFDGFMNDEYKSNMENLHRTNQLLAEKFMQLLDN